MYTECPFVTPPYPAALVEAGRHLLDGVLADLQMLPHGRFVAEIAMERYPAYAEEVRAVGGVLGVDPTDVMLANLSYDLMLALFGCSTMALATPDGPVLARNMDWPLSDRLARASCITATPHGLNAGFAGAVGVVSGLSRRGFAVVLNAVIGGGPNPDGFPVLLFLRHLLDNADSFQEAVRLTATTPLAMSALITLVGTENSQRVCVERKPGVAEARWAEGDRPLIVTNHYCRLARPDGCSRFDYMTHHAPRLPQRPSDDDLIRLLRDDNVIQTITAQHVVARPAANELRLYVPTELLSEDRPLDAGMAEMRQLF
jgi:hypothetical protein